MNNADISNNLQPDKYDALFKEIVLAGWATRSDGNVDSPTGYFAVVEIPDHLHELAEMRDAVDPDSSLVTDWPESGWYVTVENSDGLIWVFRAGSQLQADTAYDEQVLAYADWDDQPVD
jgi:hypothetical protein